MKARISAEASCTLSLKLGIRIYFYYKIKVKFTFYINLCGDPGELSQFSDRLWAGQPGYNSQQGQEIFLYITVL
jgi:hypothetical protein